MEHKYDEEDYNSPELLEQDEIDMHVQYLHEMKSKIEGSLKRYADEMTHKQE